MAVQTFLRLVAGFQNVIKTVEVGIFSNTPNISPSANAVPNTNANGVLEPSLLNATVLSAGAADGNKIVQLNSNGKIDTTILPTTVGVETVAVTASEALSAGDFVNVYNNAGNPAVRKADATAFGKQANGFVLAGVASGAQATVYLEGTNNACTGRTPGAPQFLSAVTPGKPNEGTTEALPTTAASIVQNIGVAVNATTVTFSYEPPVLNT